MKVSPLQRSFKICRTIFFYGVDRSSKYRWFFVACTEIFQSDCTWLFIITKGRRSRQMVVICKIAFSIDQTETSSIVSPLWVSAVGIGGNARCFLKSSEIWRWTFQLWLKGSFRCSNIQTGSSMLKLTRLISSSQLSVPATLVSNRGILFPAISNELTILSLQRLDPVLERRNFVFQATKTKNE